MVLEPFGIELTCSVCLPGSKVSGVGPGQSPPRPGDAHEDHGPSSPDPGTWSSVNDTEKESESVLFFCFIDQNI